MNTVPAGVSRAATGTRVTGYGDRISGACTQPCVFGHGSRDGFTDCRMSAQKIVRDPE